MTDIPRRELVQTIRDNMINEDRDHGGRILSCRYCKVFLKEDGTVASDNLGRVYDHDEHCIIKQLEGDTLEDISTQDVINFCDMLLENLRDELEQTKEKEFVSGKINAIKMVRSIARFNGFFNCAKMMFLMSEGIQ